MQKFRLFALSLLLGLSSASTALADGRFPRAQRLVEHPSDPNRLAVSGTYGLLLTTDRGTNWRHICDSAFALQASEGLDPWLALGSDGALLAGTARSLNRSTDACSWTSVLGGMEGDATRTVLGLTRDKEGIFLAAVGSLTDTTTAFQLHESADDGRTWQPIGSALPLQTLTSLQVSPQDSARLYAAGLSDANVGLIARTADRGQNWETYEIAGADADHVPYVAALHPTNPDVVYVRLDTWQENEEGLQAANDALLYSADGGASFDHVFVQPAKLFGVALSADGSEVLAGYGDPVDGGGRVVDETALGIYKSSTAETPFAFNKIYVGSVTCLTWNATGLYVCTSSVAAEFELGFSSSANFTLSGGGPLTPLLKLIEVAPLACAAETCLSDWPITCDQFGACGNAAGSLDWNMSGPGGASSTGGAAGANAATGGSSSGGGGAGNIEPSERESGCACRLTPNSRRDFRWLLALAALLWVRRRRDTAG